MNRINIIKFSVAPVFHVPFGENVPVSDQESWRWAPVNIPVDILSWLQNQAVLPNPLVSKNDLLTHWTEELDWAFKADFSLPPVSEIPTNWHLHLKGVDLYAEIFVNGERAGKVMNQFREHYVDIDDHVQPGQNSLILYIRSTKRLTARLEQAHGDLPSGFDTARVHARRMQCATGWDWANRLSSCGIYDFVAVMDNPPLRLDSPNVVTRFIDTVEAGAARCPSASIAFHIDTMADRKFTGNLKLNVTGPQGVSVYESEVCLIIKKGRQTHTFNANLPDLELWWPHTWGGQPIYEASYTLTADDRIGFRVEDSGACRFGVRTASLMQEKDESGESFVIKVNGHPVYCRGANWIPVTMLPTQANEATYRKLLAMTADAGMNCLRVWGGGIYEPDFFYETCDRLGLLVWQDFMFACAAYPAYRDFVEEVEAEAAYQIRRLRAHPSIVLWCGNNENEWLHQIGALKKGNEAHIIGEVLWSKIIKGWVEELDPTRPYHQSSPFGKNRSDLNDERTGDRHHWQAWAMWQSPDSYLSDSGRFLSEFGFQGMPNRESIEEMAPGAWSVDNPNLIHHQKMVEGNERLARYMSEVYGMPKEFDEWIEGTQRLQAEVLRRAVEHWRRMKWHNAGALIWQLNDAYPSISWSMIDFYGRPKKSYDRSRRFFAPVLLSGGLFVDDNEVGALPPNLWCRPEERIADSFWEERAATSRVPRPKVALQSVLVNDLPFAIKGSVRLSICDTRSREVAHTESYETEVSGNGRSEALIRQLDGLNLSDITGTYIVGEFTPDDETRKRMDEVADAAREKVRFNARGAWEPQFNLTDGLRFKMPLVQPKYFRWEDVSIYGDGKPAWLG